MDGPIAMGGAATLGGGCRRRHESRDGSFVARRRFLEGRCHCWGASEGGCVEVVSRLFLFSEGDNALYPCLFPPRGLEGSRFVEAET